MSFVRKNGEFVAYQRGVRLSLTVSPKAAKMLRQMLATGLWGRSQAEVAQRLIYQGLRDRDVTTILGNR